MYTTGLPKSLLSVALSCTLYGTVTAYAASPTIEEIVVTAQKRGQNMQDVPIAMSAFNEDQLKSLDAANLQSMTEHIAGAELFDDRGAGQPTWVIRGVGLSDFNANNTPTAAIYYDEQYLASNILGGIGMFDMERIEVLKGPQGGLYGRNTSGGAVKVISKKPELDSDLGGTISLSYGRWGRTTAEGAIGGALTETTAFRLAAMSDQGGGWQDSLTTPGDDEYGDRDFTSVRGQLLWAPTESVDVLFKVEGGKDRSETPLAVAKAMYDGQTGDFCGPALAGKVDANRCVTLSNLTNNWVLTPGDSGLLASQQSSDGSGVLTNPINQLDNAWQLANLKVDWDLGTTTFTSISTYLKYDNKQVYDYDGEPLTFLHEDSDVELKSWSQEFRLASNDTGKLSWLAGLIYSEDSDKEHKIADLSDNYLIFPGKSIRGFEQITQSWSAYAQMDYEINNQWVLHSSLRYTDEDKQLNDAFHYDDLVQFYYLNNVNKDYTLKANWSGHIGVDWMPTNNTMLYAKITKGFKSGGFYGGFAFSPEELEPYKEETIWAYEIGFKTDWLENSLRVNGAVYYYDYRDIQGFTQINSSITNTSLTKLGNLGDAEHTGAELDIIWYPQAIEGLSLQAGVAWLNAEVTDSDTLALDPNGVASELEGRQRSFAPEWSTTLQARYERDLSNTLTAAVQLNYSWRDDITPRESFGTDLHYAAYGQSGYELLNARLSLFSFDNQWEIALAGKNLLNEKYPTIATGNDLGSFSEMPGLPRSWQVEVNYNWE
ncbi:TonB-dependent receptor [Aestuariicella sp. G3-2]|uniref:TonB-dependent receptor n=1 Tax=Pseudomaricurvus albidus TaxID=2842452 RepID=UPI001C0DBC84|nr:TonB-dependent receptor [Aestuariicella albida]MBU3069387.1 TonB-dependent receptor [Aestuariicella albida]